MPDFVDRQTEIATLNGLLHRRGGQFVAVYYSLAHAFWRALGRNEPPRFASWEMLFEEIARQIAIQPFILIFDEFPYAVESDAALPSHLQAAWDHLLKTQSVVWCWPVPTLV